MPTLTLDQISDEIAALKERRKHIRDLQIALPLTSMRREETNRALDVIKSRLSQLYSLRRDLEDAASRELRALVASGALKPNGRRVAVQPTTAQPPTANAAPAPVARRAVTARRSLPPAVQFYPAQPTFTAALPASAIQYRTELEPEYELYWRPHRDARPLTGDVPTKGSSLLR